MPCHEEMMSATEKESFQDPVNRGRYEKPEVIQRCEAEAPLISVIIPAYNVEKYLAETLESVLRSPASLFEIVAVNDGSTDDTEAILTRYARADHQHFTVLTQSNRGLGAARNIAMDYAKGKYVLFLDSDDLLAEGALETLARIVAERDLDMLHYNGLAFFESRALEEEYPFYLTAYQYSAELPGVMTGIELYCRMREDRGYYATSCLAVYRGSFLRDRSIRFLEGVFHEDNLFTLQSMLLAKRAAHIPDRFLLRRVREGSVMTMKKDFRHFHGYLQTILREKDVLNSIPFDQKLYRYIAADIRGATRRLYETYLQLEDKHAVLTGLDPVEYFFARVLLDAERSRRQREKTAQSASPSGSFFNRFVRGAHGPDRDGKKPGLTGLLHRVLTCFHRFR